MSKVRVENRVIRPYLGIESFDGALQQVQLKVNNKVVQRREYFQQPEFSEMQISLRVGITLAELQNSASELELGLENLRLVVFTHSKSLGRTKVLRDWQLAEDKIEDLDFHSSDLPAVFLDQRSGFEISCALILGSGLSPAPLKVYEKGTWLAISRWEILPDREVSLFSPKPMDRQTKKSLNLDAKALIYVEAKSKSLWAARDIDDAITVWVDEETLNEIATSKSPQSRTAEFLLARLALEALVNQISSALNQEKTPLEETARRIETKEIEGNVFTLFFEKTKNVLSDDGDIAQSMRLIRDNPALASSLLEASTDLRNELKKLLKESVQ